MSNIRALDCALRTAAATVALILALCSSVHGADFQVTTTTDLPDLMPGDGFCATTEAMPAGAATCSLRAAIEEANALAGGDVVRIPAGVFTLPNGQLNVTDSIELVGFGMEATVIDGLGQTRIIDVHGGPDDELPDLIASDLKLWRGLAGSGNGAALRCESGGAIALSRVRISQSLAGGYGGGVFAGSEGGFPGPRCGLTIVDSLIDGNSAASGAGVALWSQANGGPLLTISRSRFEGNHGSLPIYGSSISIGCCGARLTDTEFVANTGAGVILHGGDAGYLRMDRVLIEGNQGFGLRIGDSETNNIFVIRSRIVGNQGTGIINLNKHGRLEIDDTEISGNSSATDGGGIYVGESSRSNLRNVTISGNTASRGGGIFAQDIYPFDSATITIENSTLTKNIANEGGGIFLPPASWLNLKNSVVANNQATAGTDCFADSLTDPDRPAEVILLGTNLIGAIDGCGDLVGGEAGLLSGTAAAPLSPQLGELSYNGGPTRTHLPLSGSPLVDAVAASVPCLATDQRGVLRPQDGNGDSVPACDIGAVEVGDFDQDGIADSLDLCPGVADAAQTDLDGDGLGDGCDPFPLDPQNEKTACELDVDSCSSDFYACDAERMTCVDDLSANQTNLGQCQASETVLLQSLDSCQTGPPLVGDINRDNEVDLLDTVLSRRLLAALPINPESPAVKSLKLRQGKKDKFLGNVRDGDVYSLSSLSSCLAIQIELNQSGTSLRYDWTPPGGAQIEAYFSENNEPFCWPIDEGWAFFPEVADCGCSSEMKQLGDHELVITPCSVDVNFGANETCVGNGGVEGPPTAVHFSIVP
jgi:predicted outer membrane repeat protein